MSGEERFALDPRCEAAAAASLARGCCCCCCCRLRQAQLARPAPFLVPFLQSDYNFGRHQRYFCASGDAFRHCCKTGYAADMAVSGPPTLTGHRAGAHALKVSVLCGAWEALQAGCDIASNGERACTHGARQMVQMERGCTAHELCLPTHEDRDGVQLSWGGPHPLLCTCRCLSLGAGRTSTGRMQTCSLMGCTRSVREGAWRCRNCLPNLLCGCSNSSSIRTLADDGYNAIYTCLKPLVARLLADSVAEDTS